MHGEMQVRLIVLTEEIASALSSEFKLYIPEILPHLLHIFMYDTSTDKAVTQQVCIIYHSYSLLLFAALHPLLNSSKSRARAILRAYSPSELTVCYYRLQNEAFSDMCLKRVLKQ